MNIHKFKEKLESTNNMACLAQVITDLKTVYSHKLKVIVELPNRYSVVFGEHLLEIELSNEILQNVTLFERKQLAPHSFDIDRISNKQLQISGRRLLIETLNSHIARAA